MRILLVMDPGIRVPPQGYGGHERLVAMFAEEYARKGHTVHVLATEGSAVPGCTMHSLGPEGFPPTKGAMRRAMWRAWRLLHRWRNDFGLVHNFGRLAYLLPLLHRPVRKIMTYGREISRRNIQWATRLPSKNLVFTGCSRSLIARSDPPGDWRPVYNAIDFSRYDLAPTVPPDAPLMFLGRVERVKGCHVAIEVARRTDRRLVIGGNVSPLEEERKYFKNEIEPNLDGDRIVYAGALDDERKNALLGAASALLFPIDWEEPFGMVMVEAMACGTPVVAFRRGAVPEVVDEGVTGFVVDSIDEMIHAVEKTKTVDRERCRERARARFDVSVIADDYLGLFDDSHIAVEETVAT